MTVNRFYKPTEIGYIDTYVPINFDQLYKIGVTQKAAVDEARKELNTQLAKWNEFYSPSDVDTQNWYNLTTGFVQDLVNQAAANPDLMKDAAWRAQLQNRINSVDRAALSRLQTGAKMLEQRNINKAKLVMDNAYNEAWDHVDVSNYDTLKQGILQDLSPVRYMNANEMSNKYFDNLQKGYIDSVYKNGVLYDVVGNTEGDLLQVYDRYANDLKYSAQGQEYIKQFMRSGATQEEAEEAFKQMIVGSQMDRVIRPDYEVNKGWEMQMRYAMSNAGSKSKSGKEDKEESRPTRLGFIDLGIKRSVEDKENSAFNGLLNSSNSGISSRANQELAYYQQVGDQYNRLLEQAMAYANSFKNTNSQEDLVKYSELINAANELELKTQTRRQNFILNNEFENTAKFALGDKENYSHEGYVRGVKSALNTISGHVSLMPNDDIISGVGGVYHQIADEDGTEHQSYSFVDSRGFFLPETVFNQITGNTPRDHEYDTVRQAVESGMMQNVEFLPTGEIIKVGQDGTLMLEGKLRISEEELEEKGDVSWSTSNEKMIKRRFGGREVEQKVGDDNKTYYEMTVYKALPTNAPEYQQRLNQRWQGGSDAGIGGASQADKTYMDSAEEVFYVK